MPMIQSYNGVYSGGEKKVINLEPTFFSVLGSAQAAVSIADVEKQPFIYHAWTHACAWVIARNISYLPIRLLDKRDHTEVEDKHGILQLLSNPNPVMTRTTFFQTIILGLVLADAMRSTGGQVFVIPRSADPKNDGKINIHKGDIMPDVLLPYTTKYFTPVTKAVSSTDNLQADMSQQLQELVSWKFMVPGSPSSAVYYLPDEVIRIHLVNPYEWLKGTSSYTAARIAIMQDIKSDIYNNSLFDNNATPAGVLKTDRPTTRDQRQETVRSWYEEYGGTANAGKLAILDKGMEYQRIALTAQDMQFMETKNYSLEQIIASFGLNKIALGLYEEVNYSTIVEARRWLWQDTYVPLAMTILEAINSQWISYIDDSIELAFDTSGVEALQLDYTKRISAAAQMVKDMRVPPTMAMRINGVPFSKEDVANYPWLNEPVLPAAPAMPPQSVPPPPPAKVEQVEHSETKAVEEIPVSNKNIKQAFSDDYVARVLKPGENEFKKSMLRFFGAQETQMLENLNRWVSHNKAMKDFSAPSLSQITLDIAAEDEAMLKTIRPLVKIQLGRSEAKLKEEIGNLVRWSVTDPTIDKYTANRRAEVHHINSTTMQRVGDDVNTTISTMRKENATVQQVGAAIKEDILKNMEIRAGQAEMIATTEIGIITSTSRFEAMKAEGINTHEWITANDDRVRDSHVTAGAAGPIPLGAKFPGVNMAFPLDSSGAVGDIVNCRCVAVAVEAGPTPEAPAPKPAPKPSPKPAPKPVAPKPPQIVEPTPTPSPVEPVKPATGNVADGGANLLFDAQNSTRADNVQYIKNAVLRTNVGDVQGIPDSGIAHIRASIEHYNTTFGVSKCPVYEVRIESFKSGQPKGVSDDTSAYYSPSRNSLTINMESMQRPDKLNQWMAAGVREGYYPVGCRTIKSMIDHELGHAHMRLRVGGDSEQINYVKNSGVKERSIKRGLSTYATKNPKETLAEAFAEYMNNPEPREISKKLMEKLIKGGKQ